MHRIELHIIVERNRTTLPSSSQQLRAFARFTPATLLLLSRSTRVKPWNSPHDTQPSLPFTSFLYRRQRRSPLARS